MTFPQILWSSPERYTASVSYLPKWELYSAPTGYLVPTLMIILRTLRLRSCSHIASSLSSFLFPLPSFHRSLLIQSYPQPIWITSQNFTAMPWLPPEILLIITSYIHDPETLVSLQLVSKDWSAAAVSQLDRGFLLLNMNKVTQDIIEKKRKTARTRELVRGVVVNCPDGDYWRVREQAQSMSTA